MPVDLPKSGRKPALRHHGSAVLFAIAVSRSGGRGESPVETRQIAPGTSSGAGAVTRSGAGAGISSGGAGGSAMP
jgi:hypothetical protein